MVTLTKMQVTLKRQSEETGVWLEHTFTFFANLKSKDALIAQAFKNCQNPEFRNAKRIRIQKAV